MRRIDDFIKGLLAEENCKRLSSIVCTDIDCYDCPANNESVCEEQLAKWLMEEIKTETYTERVITAYGYSIYNGTEYGHCDHYSEETVMEYTFIIHTNEDEEKAKDKELSLRSRGYEVKVQNFIHEKTETLPWDKEREE